MIKLIKFLRLIGIPIPEPKPRKVGINITDLSLLHSRIPKSSRGWEKIETDHGISHLIPPDDFAHRATSICPCKPKQRLENNGRVVYYVHNRKSF